MLSKLQRIVSSPADLIVAYLFTVFHYVRFNVGWPARKFYLTVVFLAALVWELIHLIRSRRFPHFQVDLIFVLTLLLGASIVLTAFFSKYGYLAYDPEHPEEGAIIWCVYLLIFLMFREEYIPKKSHLLMLLLSGYIECLLVIINNCIYNIYGVNSSIYGNYNLLGIGMSIYYALNLMMLADEDEAAMCCIHCILAFFFSTGLIFSRSDNTLLCIAAMLGALPFLRRITANLLKKLLQLLAILFLSMAAVRLLILLPSFKEDAPSSILFVISRKLSPFLTVALGLVIFALQMLIPEEHSFLRLTVILRVLVIILLFSVIVCLLLVNFAGVSFGTADKFLKFDDYWGSERGQIWRICLLAFLKFATPLQKLFGTGINSTPFFTWDYAPKNVSTMLANYCTPHNFLLQWLIEGGIFGLGLFCLFCFLALKVAFKCKSIYHLLSSVVVIVILAGWLVTVHSPDITPYFIVFLAICAAPKNFEAGE